MKRYGLLFGLTVAAAPSAALTADEVAAAATAAWKADYETIQDYRCHFVSVRFDGDGNEEQRTAGFNYFKRPSRAGQELTELYVKGKKRDIKAEEMRSESYSMKLPFDEEYGAAYTFEMAGAAAVAGKPCYILKFASENKGDEYIHGRAWVETDTSKISALDVAYYKNPKYVTDLAVKMWFADFDGHRMVHKISAVGHYSAYLIFTGDFTFVETYDDYQFNVGVPDDKVR